MSLKKIFISGKITGEPIDGCLAKFFRAERNLCYMMSDGEIEESDFVNPLNLKGIYFGIEHEKAMEICLEALKDCQAIYMLKDWKESTGAKIEHQFALDNGLEIIYQ